MCVLFLNGCGARTKIINWAKGDAEVQAENIANTITKAIEEKDADAIKKLMAKDALLGIDDIDAGIQELFDNVEGEISELDSDGNAKSTSSGGDTGYCGQPTHKEIRGSYIFKAGDKKYKMLFIDNFQGTTKENTGLYGIKIIKYEDYENGLNGFFNAANYNDINFIKTDDLKNVQDKMNAEGQNGFWDIADDITGDLQFNREPKESFVCNVKQEDLDGVNKLLYGEVVHTDVNLEEYGFDKNGYSMYVSAIIDVELKESKKYVSKVIWIKDDENQKVGMTYYAIMPKEKYDSGEKFPEGEGIFIIE